VNLHICELFNQKYFVVDTNGYPQALDENSGGYNYTARGTEVKFWIKKEDALKYLAVVNWKEEKLFLCQVTDILAIQLVGSDARS
jgi:hypothetical protein